MAKTVFVDGNPALGQIGTLVTAAFLNALQNHRHDGLDQDGSAPTVYAVGAGSANVYTAAFTPALTAHCTGLSLMVKFPATNDGASTFNPNGLGAKSIVRPDGTPLKAYDILSGGIYQLVYDGTNYQVSSVSAQPSVSGTFSNLKASASGLSAVVSVTADEIVVGSGASYQTLTGVSLSIAGTSVGANGLDTGSLAASTWYGMWVIYNPSNKTVAGLMSLSATAPALPSGYTYKARIGWIRTDATNKYPLGFIQAGQAVQYKIVAGSNLTAYPVMASGVQGSLSTPTWVAVAWATFAPSTAAALNISANGAIAPSTTAVSPNNAVGAMTSNANRPALIAGTGQISYYGYSSSAMIIPESTNIYVAAEGGGGSVTCLGWEDNL